MIVIRLAGGLGNQIFQLAAGLLLASKTDSQKLIIEDSALGDYRVKRQNNLSDFFDFTLLDYELVFENMFLSKLRIPKVLPLNALKYPFVGDRNFQSVKESPNNLFLLLDGYFQECLTQYDFDEEIRLLKKLLKTNNGRIDNDCVVHIRGGDFVKLGWNSVTPTEYYTDAMNIMVQKYQVEKFHIVTDDHEYSKTILKDIPIDHEFIGGSMHEDFNLIGSFQKRILSSSTFALWSSALGDNGNSIVIAPGEWLPNKKRKIFLPNEIRI